MFSARRIVRTDRAGSFALKILQAILKSVSFRSPSTIAPALFDAGESGGEESNSYNCLTTSGGSSVGLMSQINNPFYHS